MNNKKLLCILMHIIQFLLYMTHIIDLVNHQENTPSPESHMTISLFKCLSEPATPSQLQDPSNVHDITSAPGSAHCILQFCFENSLHLLFYTKVTDYLESLSGSEIYLSPVLCITRPEGGNVFFDSQHFQIILHDPSFEASCHQATHTTVHV